MSSEMVVKLGQSTLEIAVILAAPLLISLAVISLAINIVQVLTSLQDNTISSVPRLLATAVGALLLMPWMLRKLALFTLQLFVDFRPFLR
ncbi:MAG TPA: flagellar biosynthetic protein FliQ [Terriglobales bacterium]|nr:flagellar biosynthetic protein FliQ [Terriglobales bacterium]